MHIVVVGLSHRTAPIELRERVAFGDSVLSRAYKALRSRPSFSETLILSTCNRTELYGVLSHAGHDRALTRFLSEFHNVAFADLSDHVYVHHDADAVRHLMRVAAGIDSLVVGEPQILQQVRAAYAAAEDAGCVGSILHALCRGAIAAGKRVRTETEVGSGGFSIGRAAVDLAASIFGSLRGKTAMILGAGKMSELTAKHLVAAGVRTILVANRTFARAQDLATKLDGQAIRYDDLEEAATGADVIICSTAAPTHVIDRERLAPIMRRRRGRSLFLIDIAVPRDVAPDAADLENVFLYDIDDLQEVVAGMARDREAEVGRVEHIVDEETDAFIAWWHALEAAPVVELMGRKLEEIRRSELARLRTQIPDLSDRAWQYVEAATRSMMSRVTRDPIKRLKAESNGEGEGLYTLIEAAREIHGLLNDAPAPEALHDEVSDTPPPAALVRSDEATEETLA